jgi:hypothetical protein
MQWRLKMRDIIAAGLVGYFLAVTAVTNAQAPERNRKFDGEGSVAKIIPATDAEKKEGIVATMVLKDKDLTIQITNKTELQIAKGKLVEKGSADDLKKEDRVSVWYKGKPDKSDAPNVKAERVMIFRAGKSDLPPVPPRDK